MLTQMRPVYSVRLQLIGNVAGNVYKIRRKSARPLDSVRWSIRVLSPSWGYSEMASRDHGMVEFGVQIPVAPLLDKYVAGRDSRHAAN
jgi:hypothetical protein